MELEKGSGKVSHPSHLFIRIRTKLTLNPDGRLENLFIALKLATPDDANETAVRKSDDRKRALLLHYVKRMTFMSTGGRNRTNIHCNEKGTVRLV